MSHLENSPAIVILKILTPLFIKKITKLVQQGQRVSLTKLLLNEVSNVNLSINESQDESKILEFNPKINKDNDEKVSYNVKHEEENLKELDCENENASLSIFILRQKEKLKNGQKMLKRGEVLTLYSSASSLNLNQTQLDDEDLSSEADCGTLLNKKQF